MVLETNLTLNRRIRNRMSGGVGGRRGQPRLLPDFSTKRDCVPRSGISRSNFAKQDVLDKLNAARCADVLRLVSATQPRSGDGRAAAGGGKRGGRLQRPPGAANRRCQKQFGMDNKSNGPLAIRGDCIKKLALKPCREKNRP
jgi:hypothetical protein